jgi:hypothetical protein
MKRSDEDNDKIWDEVFKEAMRREAEGPITGEMRMEAMRREVDGSITDD